MLKRVSKLLYVLKEDIGGLVLLLLTFTVVSVLEAVGIGFVGPFLSLAANPSSVQTIPLLHQISQSLNVQSDAQFVVLIGILLCVIFLIKSLLYFVSQAYIIGFAYGQQRKVMQKLLQAYLEVPYTFHLNHNTAGLINSITFETYRFCSEFLLPLLQAAASLVVLAVIMLLLAKTNLLFLVMVLAVLLPVFCLFYTIRERVSYWGQEGSVAYEEIIRVVNHSLGGIKETRVIGCEPYFMNQMNRECTRLNSAAFRFHSVQKLPRILIEALLVVILVIFVCISLAAAEPQQDLMAVLGVFAVAAIRLMPSAGQFLNSMNQVQNSTYSLNVIYDALKQVEPTRKLKQASKALRFERQVELSNLSYSYPDALESAISRVNLKIKKGQSIALIGKSGAGKTTLVDVILGLLTPQSGDLYVDGQSIYDDIRGWQNLVGYIPQSIFLIDDTLERNIAFGVPDELIDAEKLRQAIVAAQLQELLEQLPAGLQTVVGERGVRLSGGQRQRVGIARALYHEREILVLDEATSALDSETEALVNGAIQALSGHKTLIIIAHRLSTVKNCDYVYLLEQGRVVQSGSYQSVVLSR
ncbi:MAG: ABC transporter ATP-binding protein/permease [Pegethrix bostrychoides GSE-TBD4-15B]|jgi:ABC-type multidrug transport system fused ATPase/permease subunit|uniref:ABC transporter ATP-binding protein/permease n=1 Tax=Pegethrix bostrychoides GSE-TBD4-15B TaxID=2839662 RepID=A0A951PEJ8_9CYAN|nr:ABC transporter ATP-binding protein/permease [Pegethrix bostrychoides GSE-TBD4-15B]